MKQLREELEKAKKQVREAKNEYIKKSTTKNYEWYQFCNQYYLGLQRAFDLIEGE